MEHNQVEITSIETIKPSNPTPPHLKTYKFCLLDQLFPLIYVPQVLFYKTPTSLVDEDRPEAKNHPNRNILACLKDSLSKSLSLFYPLAGRLTEDESSINCNDKGIPFIEARAKGTLVSFLEAPNRINLLLRRFIPHNIYDHNDSSSSSSSSGQRSKVTELLLPLVVQVTTFECGGIAIGYQKLHKIVDGGSWGSFFETWAAFARGRDEDVIVTPDFTTASSLFPPCNWAMPSPGVTPIILDPFEIKEDNNNNGCIVKAFAFGPRDIAALQAKAKSESVPNPTRVEAVSGFIWKHAMAASSNSKMLGVGSSVLIHTVNMRPCVRPPLPPSTIGNLIAHAIAYSKGTNKPADELELELKDLVGELRRGISEAKDYKFLRNFQGKEGGTFVCQHMKKMMSIYENTNMNTYKFTSWSRNGLGLNADFGFGVPLWIGYIGGRVNSLLRNFIPLIGTIDNGIEAWLVLDEKDMGVLESDSEFLAFASPLN